MSGRQTEIKSSGGSTLSLVTGPASATDNAIVRFDGTTGKLVQDSGVTVSDTGQIVLPVGAAAAPSLTFSGFGTIGLHKTNAAGNGIGVDLGVGSPHYVFGPSILRLATGTKLSWSSGVPDAAVEDVAILRAAVGVLRVADATTGGGWLQETAGTKRVSADVTNATTTPANLTDLTITGSGLLAGRKYTGELVIYCDDSTAADGISFDFDGGTATMTSFIAQGTISDTAGVRNLARSAALATDIVDATTTGSALVRINVAFVVNAAGTFIPRFWQTAHTTGTATVSANSYLHLKDTP